MHELTRQTHCTWVFLDGKWSLGWPMNNVEWFVGSFQLFASEEAEDKVTGIRCGWRILTIKLPNCFISLPLPTTMFSLIDGFDNDPGTNNNNNNDHHHHRRPQHDNVTKSTTFSTSATHYDDNNDTRIFPAPTNCSAASHTNSTSNHHGVPFYSLQPIDREWPEWQFDRICK